MTAGQITYFLTAIQCCISTEAYKVNKTKTFDPASAKEMQCRVTKLIALLDIMTGYDPDNEDECLTPAEARRVLDFLARETGVCPDWLTIPDSVYPICDLSLMTGSFFYCDGLGALPTGIIVTSIDGSTDYEDYTYSWYAFNAVTGIWESVGISSPEFDFGGVYVDPPYTMYQVAIQCPGNSGEVLTYNFDRAVNPFSLDMMQWMSTSSVSTPISGGSFDACQSNFSHFVIQNSAFSFIQTSFTPDANPLTTSTSGTYIFEITHIASGCVTQQNIVANIYNNQPSITGGSIVCDGGSTLLSVGGGGALYETFQWILDGVDIPGATNDSYLATQAGSYTVRVTNNSGACTGTSAAHVLTTVALPVPVITGTRNGVVITSGQVVNSESYSGIPVILDAGAGFSSYSWNSGLFTTQIINVIIAGDYTVTVTNASGCQGEDTFTVSFLDIFLDNIYESGPGSATIDLLGTLVEPGAIVTFGPYVYRWYNSSNVLVGSGVGTGLSNTISGLAAGDYTVRVYDTNYTTATTQIFGPVTVV